MNTIKAFNEWTKEYTDKDNFASFTDHVCARMLLFSLWNYRQEEVDGLKKAFRQVLENHIDYEEFDNDDALFINKCKEMVKGKAE